jgi:hypothetical protein
MAYIAICHNENGASHFQDRDRCIWESRFKYHNKENAQKAAQRHRCWIRWEGWGYHTPKGATIISVHPRSHGIKKKKWGDKK